MSWFKKLFGLVAVTQSWLAFKCNVPMPKVKPFKKEKDVSEPVIAIAEFMQKYPSRFKVRWVSGLSEYNDIGAVYKVEDIKTKSSALMCWGYASWFTIGEWSWLTLDEIDYLENILKQTQNLKSKRQQAIKRAKYKDIYK